MTGVAHSRAIFRRIRWSGLKTLLGDSFGEWNRQNATRLGAALAFYSLLSLAPLLLLAVSIAGLVFGHSAAEHHITIQLQSLVGPAAAEAATAFLKQPGVKVGGIVGTVVSVLTLLFSASGVLVELRDSLNFIWEIPVPNVSGFAMVKAFVRERLFSFGMVLSIGFLLTISLLVSAWISALGAHSFSGWVAAALHIAASVASFVVIAAVFAAIYRLLPETRIEWRDVIVGGAVTSLLFTIGKVVLGIYLGRASYSSMYGATASVIVLIVWVYYSAQIFYLGAEFTKVYARRYGSRKGAKAAHPAGLLAGQPRN